MTETLTAAKGGRTDSLCDQMAALLRAQAALADSAPTAERLSEFFDAEDTLARQAEWTTPDGPRGAMLAAILLLKALRGDGLDEEALDLDARRQLRQASRLGERLVEYLAAEAGASVEQLGLSAIYIKRPPTLRLFDAAQ